MESPGFKITVKSLTRTDTNPGGAQIRVDQLAEKITSFINTKLASQSAMTVRLIIENWDEVFEVEETSYNLHDDGSIESTNQYPRNYWIETKEK